MRVERVATTRPSTPELDAAIALRYERAIAAADREGRRLFDGPTQRWIGHRIEEGRLIVVAGPGRYRDFVATNLAPDVIPDVAGGTLPWSHFGNAIGTSALIVTRDDRLVAGRRSRRVLAYSGHVHSFGGILEAAADGEAIDVFASLRRELHEELGLAAADCAKTTLLGVIREPRIHQPEMLFVVVTLLDLATLTKRWYAAESHDEHDELVSLQRAHFLAEPNTLDELAPVSPIGRAAFALYRRCWAGR